MAPSRTRFFFFSSWRCSTTSTPILTRARFAGLSIHHHHHHLVIAMPSPYHTAMLRCTPQPPRRSRCVGPPGFTHDPLYQRPTPSRGSPGAYPRRLVPRFPGHSRQPSRREPIRSASRPVPHRPQPSAVPPGAYPRRLVPRVPGLSHQPSPRSLSTAPRALCPRPPHSARVRMRPVPARIGCSLSAS